MKFKRCEECLAEIHTTVDGREIGHEPECFYLLVQECPYCSARVMLTDSAIVYHGKSYGPIYLCTNYPQCDAYVGLYKGTTTPLGRLANAELRRWKIAAHAALDDLWKSGRYTRHEAYRIAADMMGTPVDETHIGMMDVGECKDLIRSLRIINPKILLP